MLGQPKNHEKTQVWVSVSHGLGSWGLASQVRCLDFEDTSDVWWCNMMQPTSISLQRCLWIIAESILFSQTKGRSTLLETQKLRPWSLLRRGVKKFVRERKLVHLNGKRKLFQCRPRVQHGHFPTWGKQTELTLVNSYFLQSFDVKRSMECTRSFSSLALVHLSKQFQAAANSLYPTQSVNPVQSASWVWQSSSFNHWAVEGFLDDLPLVWWHLQRQFKLSFWGSPMLLHIRLGHVAKKKETNAKTHSRAKQYMSCEKYWKIGLWKTKNKHHPDLAIQRWRSGVCKKLFDLSLCEVQSKGGRNMS